MKKECVICGFTDLVDKHHIVPEKHGGSDEEANLVYLCPSHHRMAHIKKFKKRIFDRIKNKTGKIGLVDEKKLSCLIEERKALKEAVIADFELSTKFEGMTIGEILKYMDKHPDEEKFIKENARRLLYGMTEYGFDKIDFLTYILGANELHVMKIYNQL